MLNSKSQAGSEVESSTNVEVSTSSPNNAKPNVGCCLVCADCVEVLTSFAYVKNYTDKGRMLMIFDKQYHAWYYDTYIFDAIDLIKKWKPHQITYDRIIHLREWIRENAAHGHEMYFKHLKSMRAVKLWIDELIKKEYQDEYWKEQKELSLINNANLLSISENLKAVVV